MKVFLIRHAESEENALNYDERITRSAFNAVLLRSFESPLTTRGEQQAREVIDRLGHTTVERLYSSPMQRARSTASILGETLGLTPIVLDSLREVLPSAQPGEGSLLSLRRHFVESYAKMLWPFGNEEWENWPRAFRRAWSAWQEITREPASEIAAVSHRGTIAATLLMLRRNRDWRVVSTDLHNGGVSVIEQRTR